MARRGAPTKFTPEKGQQICERLRAGGTRKAAAESVGIAHQTLLDWIQRGKDRPNTEFAEFMDALTRAEAEAEMRFAAVFAQSAMPHDVIERKTITRADGSVETTEVTRREFDWRAAESWLKRRRRVEWGDNVDATSGGEPITKAWVGLTPDDL